MEAKLDAKAGAKSVSFDIHCTSSALPLRATRPALLRTLSHTTSIHSQESNEFDIEDQSRENDFIHPHPEPTVSHHSPPHTDPPIGHH